MSRRTVAGFGALAIFASVMVGTLLFLPPAKQIEAKPPSTVAAPKTTQAAARVGESRQEWAIVEKGHVLLISVVNGTATYRRVPLATPATPGDVKPTDPVDPPVVDPDPNLTDRGRAIQAAAKQINHADRADHAVSLAGLSREIVKISGEGKLLDSRAKMELAISEGFNRLLDGSGKGAKEAWVPMRAVLGTEWSRLSQEGASVEDHKQYLLEVADGLAASVDRSDRAVAQKALDWAKIREILSTIAWLLDLFKTQALAVPDNSMKVVN